MAASRAALDIWIGFLCGFLNLDNYNKWKTSIPNLGGGFLITRKDCPPQHGHNDFDVKESGSPGYFTDTTAEEKV